MNKISGIPTSQPPIKEYFVDIPNNRNILRYYLELYQHFSYANNFGLALDDDDRAGKKGKSILLSKLFVAPKLSDSHIRPEQLVDAEHEREKSMPERQHFADVLKAHQRLFILGDPGTGKSTLINWLMLELSYSGDSMLKLALGNVVPFAFILRDMKLGGVTSWEGLWQSWCMANLAFGPIMEKDSETLEQVFSSGQALFLLDGLDEISNRETRAGLGQAILDGLAKYPRCRFVITSRILGFSQEELLGIRVSAGSAIQMAAGYTGKGLKVDPLPVQYLSPFDPGQVRSFCRNWHSQYVAQDREKRFTDLLERLKLNDGLARLARIPVLLNIICFIHARRGQLPDGRAELYRRIAETYLTALDTARGIRFRDRRLQFDFYDLHGWLGQIAWRIQQGRGEENDSVVIDKARVEKIFRQGILDTGMSEVEAEQETTFIMDYIAERSGLFIPRGESESGETLYAFTHLSFMEYFAAAHLRSEVEFWDKDGAEWQDLREKMQEPVWKEVFILFFELMENARQTEQYLARLVGDQPDIVASSDNAMPVLEKPYQEYETWPGFYTWAMLAGVVMDTAVKMLPKGRQEYIRLLWRFVLSKNVQEEYLITGGVELILEYLWSEKQNSLEEFKAQAAKMTRLRLAGRRINDLTPLNTFVHLKKLNVSYTMVNELIPLSKLINLERLELALTEIRDLTPLSKLASLKKLNLGFTKVNDLSPLSGLDNLNILFLYDADVTDISPLMCLSSLKYLYLDESKVSERDAEEFKRRLPHTDIFINGKWLLPPSKR